MSSPELFKLFLLGAGLGVAVTLPAGAARAEAPATGLFLEARLTSINLPGANGVIGGLGGPAPATIGYRARGFTLGVGPAIHQVKNARTFCPRDPMTGGCLSSGNSESSSDTVYAIGAQILSTLTVATMHEEQGELYALAGFMLGAAFTTSDNGSDIPSPEQDLFGSPIAFGGTIGVGIRYFLVPFLAFGAELGEGYTSIPLSSNVGSAERLSSFTTWGSLNAQLVF